MHDYLALMVPIRPDLFLDLIPVMAVMPGRAGCRGPELVRKIVQTLANLLEGKL